MKAILCTDCENCPEVELTSAGVNIGEEGNLVMLTHKEWNLLVDLIQSGQLKRVPARPLCLRSKHSISTMTSSRRPRRRSRGWPDTAWTTPTWRSTWRCAVK